MSEQDYFMMEQVCTVAEYVYSEAEQQTFTIEQGGTMPQRACSETQQWISIVDQVCAAIEQLP